MLNLGIIISTSLGHCSHDGQEEWQQLLVLFRLPPTQDCQHQGCQPLPHIDYTLEVLGLHRSYYFWTLDLKARYWQIPIQEEDRHKTAFSTSSGRLTKGKMMAFGVCNSPAQVLHLMDAT